MKGMGERLRARAREMGWSDSEVARRVGVAQTRYSTYVTDRHEPDLATLVRICAILETSPAYLLGVTETAEGSSVALRARISALAEALDGASLEVAAAVLDGLVARTAGTGGKQR